MIKCHRRFLEARCRERGYTLDEVMPCVVEQDGAEWTIDTEHPKYPSPRSPSLAKKAMNLANSTVKHVSTGMAQAEKKEREKRLEICVSCDRYNAEDKTCLECGCYLEIKTKWASEACPIGLWGSTLPRKSSCGRCKKRQNKT